MQHFFQPALDLPAGYIDPKQVSIPAISPCIHLLSLKFIRNIAASSCQTEAAPHQVPFVQNLLICRYA